MHKYNVRWQDNTKKLCDFISIVVPQKNFSVFFFFWRRGGGGRADVNQQKLTKKIQGLNLIRSHVSIMTTVTVVIISLITNIKIAIIIIVITKSDYHNNDNNSNNNNNNKNDNNVFLIDHSFKKMLFNSNY